MDSGLSWAERREMGEKGEKEKEKRERDQEQLNFPKPQSDRGEKLEAANVCVFAQ